MLIITKENNSIKVVGQNNPTYPYSGTLIYPLNSVTVVTDQSNMAVFRSALNNDVLFTGLIDDITINGSPVTKEDIGNKFGAISNSVSTGGGGAVDSVNGHTGAVVLTASDVNAYTKEESDGKYATKTEIPSIDNLATKEELALKADKSSLGDYLLKSEAQSNYETINGAQSKYQAKLTAGTGIEITGENVINVTLDTNIYKVVESLPDTEINPNKIYLVLSAESGETNLYTEYLYVNNKWEEIGKYKADVDLTPYLKSSDAASTYATKQELEGEASEREQAITNLTATVQGKLDTATYNEEKATFALKTEIPDTSNLATKTELSEGLAGKANTSDLSNYLTTANAQSTYATKSELEAKLDVETYNSDKATFALKSELPDTSDFATTEQLNGKQDALVSGTNIKTINGNSLLGSGDITIEGGGTPYTAGEGIGISETNVISVDKETLNIPTLQTNKNGSTNNYVYSTGNHNSKKTNVIADVFFANDNFLDQLRCYVRYWGNDSTYDVFITIPNANSTSAGAMSSLDKDKLDSIDVASILSRITALETQMGEVSAKLDNINGETI